MSTVSDNRAAGDADADLQMSLQEADLPGFRSQPLSQGVYRTCVVSPLFPLTNPHPPVRSLFCLLDVSTNIGETVLLRNVSL